MSISTDEFIRSATFSAVTSATHAFVESLETELRDRVMTENNEVAHSALAAMIESELPANDDVVESTVVDGAE